MQQITKYRVENLGVDRSGDFSPKDSELLTSVLLPSISFIPGKHRVDLSFYDFNGKFVETIQDVETYKIHGVIQKGDVKQIDFDPVKDALDYGYLGDVDLQYSFSENLFSQTRRDLQRLYIVDISSDRTEIRARSLHLLDRQVKDYVDQIHEKLTTLPYFPEIYLEFLDFPDMSEKPRVINIKTEVLDGVQNILLKLYSPLSDFFEAKDQFFVRNQVADPVRFRVIREVELVEDKGPQLRGPNFEQTSTKGISASSEFLSLSELLSSPVLKPSSSLEKIAKAERCTIGLDYSDFSEFIHFSSIAERLLNFRYKMETLDYYEDSLKELDSNSTEFLEVEKLRDGLINNFDHYEQYLYFESGSKAWPKENSKKPYINQRVDQLDSEWWDTILEEATSFDDTNKDILIGSIPFAIREDPENEPYVVFIHMIGQHFDNQWIYAKALSSKYKADNRPDFGIPKDLVKEAIRDLGIELQESNQNLSNIFKHLRIDGTYDNPDVTVSGSFIRISDSIEKGSTEFQPMSRDSYVKEVYKRIYHNFPILIKSKGTQRGLRTLINCFGIPESILSIEVLGGIKTDSQEGYFGPLEGVTSSIDKVRLDCTSSLVPLMVDSNDQKDPTVVVPVLSRDTSVVSSSRHYSDDSHQIVLGFNLNKESNDYFKSQLSTVGFDYDDILGDPRNLEENYKNVFSRLRNSLLLDPNGIPKVSFRSPTAILMLVRYFDSILFNSVQDFLPAKSNVSTGAIVEDSILHRNRYNGLKTSAEGIPANTLETAKRLAVSISESYFCLDGAVDIVAVTGSSGGHYFDSPVNQTSRSVHEFPTYWNKIVKVTGSVPVGYFPWSTGLLTGSKLSHDNSPNYNGEFSGSFLQASSAEILNNPYKRGGSNVSTYKLSAMFESLPSPLLCDFLVDLKDRGDLHTLSTLSFAPINSKVGTDVWYTTNSVGTLKFVKEFLVPDSGTVVTVESKSVSLGCQGHIGQEMQCFVGWTSGSEDRGSEYYELGYSNSGSNSLDVPRGTLEFQTALYSPAKKHDRFRIQVEKYTNYLDAKYYYSAYGNGGLVLSYVVESFNGSESYNRFLNSDIEVEVKYVGGLTETFTFNLSMLDPRFSHATVGQYGVIPFAECNSGNLDIEAYGIKSIGNVQHPTLVVLGGEDSWFLDADWIGTFGSGTEPGNWNYDNTNVNSGHAWKISWVSGSGDYSNRFRWEWLK